MEPKSERCKKLAWVAALLITLLLAAVAMYYDAKISRETNIIEQKMEGNIEVINKDKNLNDLKRENRELYDSLEMYKEKLDYAIQFSYTKKYNTDTVWITKTKKVYTPVEIEKIKEEVRNDSTVMTYEYENDKNDSINYKLKIGSTAEPKWYALDMQVSDKFTIVNKKDGNVNTTNIESGNKGEITNVTVFNKKEKTRVMNKIAIGPSISFGYDFAHKKLAPTIGISVTYNLFGK